MPQYCEKCHIVFENDRCIICNSRNVREARPDDLCFLCEKQIMWSEMLEDVLKNNGIPVITKKKLGIGLALKVGPMMERVIMFVPYSCLQEAKMIVEELFSESNDG